MSTPSPRRRVLTRLLLVALALLTADQVVNWFVIGDGWLLGRRIAPFDPPLFMPGQFDTLDRLARAESGAQLGDVEFDAELGWTLPRGAPGIDWCGGRIGAAEVPKQRTDGVRRIATFGCSFTYGSEVPGADSWPALLDASRADVEVLNFGVPGYGADQALMRYRRVGPASGADEVWLGLLPATVLRLVSMYRPALRHYTNTVAMKPRFRLGPAGELQPVPHPAASVADLVATIRDPARFTRIAASDSFMARWPAAYAPRGSRLAHWFATTRVLLTALERGGRDWKARIEDPTDECFALAIAIITRMRDEVVASGARFRLVILPDRGSLDLGLRSDLPWTRLVGQLAREGIEVIETTHELIRASVAADDAMWASEGHYSERCNAAIAAFLAQPL